MRSLSELLEEHRALLVMLNGTLCFGCGVRFGDPDKRARGCVTCVPARILIACCKSPTAERPAA